MIRVYVAGPISSDPALGLRRALDAFDDLVDADMNPYLPHVNVLARGQEWATWMRMDREWLEHCHALLRLPGESAGADVEEGWARAVGIPVFYDLSTLMEWARRPGQPC